MQLISLYQNSREGINITKRSTMRYTYVIVHRGSFCYSSMQPIQHFTLQTMLKFTAAYHHT